MTHRIDVGPDPGRHRVADAPCERRTRQVGREFRRASANHLRASPVADDGRDHGDSTGQQNCPGENRVGHPTVRASTPTAMSDVELTPV